MSTGPNIPRDYKYLVTMDSFSSRPDRRGPLQKFANRFNQYGRSFGRATPIMLALVIVAITSCVMIANSSISTDLTSQTEILEIALPEPRINTGDTLQNDEESAWHQVIVRKGETLGQIFAAQGLTPTDVHRVVHSSEESRQLTRIYPGDALMFRFNEDNKLESLKYQLDETRMLEVVNGVDGYSSQIHVTELLRQTRQASGVINNSLFLAGQRAGLSDSLIMQMAQLFGWDIDFVLDIRQGDSFHVIYEELYRNGELIRTGEILGATFINQGDTYSAVRYETDDGVEYFAPDGRNMKKSFLRAPLKFSAVTSNFNPRRLHPVLKTVRPHRGVDYAAPVGTPVYSTGKGKVIKAAYDKLNGHHVFVQHSNNIVTKYLHFTKRAVKVGQRIKQGQVVGYLGATGRVTGAHLHYEFVVNGVHRNPRTVKLPKAKPLPKDQMTEFLAVATPYLDRLQIMQQSGLIARNSQ